MDIEQRTIRKLKMRLLPLLIAAAIMCFVDRVNVAFGAAGMMRDLGFTATVYGFGAGLFAIPYIIFEVPSNVILARVGARIWLARIMITWGLISAAMAFIVGEYSFYGLRVLLGVAEAGLFPGVLFYLSLWFPKEYRGRIIGIFYMSLPLANVLGAPVSGFILALEGVAGLHGWQWLFLIEGLLPVLLAFALYFYLPDAPDKARWLEPEERDWLVGSLQAEHKAVHVGQLSVLKALSDARVLALGAIVTCEVVSNYGLGFFLPLILKGFGLSNMQTGFVAAIPFLVGSFACYICGKTSDRLNERKLHVAGALAIAGTFIGLSTLFDSPVLQMVMLSIAGFGMYAYLAPFWWMCTTYATSIGPVGGAAALAAVNSIAQLGGFLSPWAIGYLRDATGTYTAGLLGISAVSFIGVALVFIFSQSLNRAISPQASRAGAD
jgi:ACS family tartrate transporter-like MFS transporter